MVIINTMPLGLSKHVTYSRIGDVTIFLDIQQDRYSFVGEAATRALNELEQRSGKGGSDFEKDDTTSDALRSLISSGFVTESGSGCLSAFHRDKPHSSVQDTFWPMSIQLISILKLRLYYQKAKRLTEKRTFFNTIRSAEAIKMSSSEKFSTVSIEDVRTFSRRLLDARPFAYSHFNNCFLDSYIFFMMFLDQHIEVDWVFGVDLSPFSAHSWVEYKGEVINDKFERAYSYVPIYAI